MPFYRSEQTVSEFLFSILDCIKQDILTNIHKSSTTADESSDIAVLKQPSSTSRPYTTKKLECHIMGIRDLVDGRAATVKKCILEFLHDTRFDINDVSSFDRYGASVMTGCKEGVPTQLKCLNKIIISIHCVAHRLALATSQASQSIPYLCRLKEILAGLFHFYHNSAVHQAGLTLSPFFFFTTFFNF